MLPLVKALFLHIQKTAGSSILDLVKKDYGSDSVISHGDFISHTAIEFAEIPFVSGHFGYEYARELMPGRFTFTFLRNPVERVLSLYYFSRSQDAEKFPIYELARELDLDQFLTVALDGSNYRIRSHIWNNQVWQLAHGYGISGAVSAIQHTDVGEDRLLELAVRHAETLSFIGFTESFKDDYLIICAALNLNHPRQSPRSNVTPIKPPKEDLSDEVYEKLKKLTSLDQKLYDHMWRMRSEKITSPLQKK